MAARLVSHDGVAVRALGSPVQCPLPGVEGFTVEVLLVGPLTTPDHMYGDAVSRAWVWVPGVAPAGLVLWGLVRFDGLMVDAGPVFWAESAELLDDSAVSGNVVEVRS